TVPPSQTWQTVSSPSNTSSTCSPSAGGAVVNVVAYGQLVPPIHWGAAPFASRYGRGWPPAASRSVWTVPGTVAGRVRPVTSGGAGPSSACKVQPVRASALTSSAATLTLFPLSG